MLGDLYKLTSEGRKIAGSISPSRRDDILDSLYVRKAGVTLEELEATTGKPRGVLRSTLNKYKARGYVRCASSGMGV